MAHRGAAVHARVESTTVEVRLTPRARADEVGGVRDGALLVRVTAPPVDGRANKALCRLLAKRVGTAPTNVTVIRGESSRDKVVRFDGVDRATVRLALGLDQVS